MQTYELYVLKLFGLADYRNHIAHGDTKLVLGQTSGDVGVGVGTYVGVKAEGYASHLALSCCQLVNHLEFGNAFYIEAENVVIEAKIDFPITLAYTCINNLVIGEARFERCFYLAATNAIGSKTSLADNAEHTRISVGLNGIVYHKALVLACLLVDGLQSLAQ